MDETMNGTLTQKAQRAGRGEFSKTVWFSAGSDHAASQADQGDENKTPSATSPQIELAQLTLAVGVPIEIDHLRRQEPSGPNDYQIEAAQGYIDRQELGEAIMFATKHDTAEQMRLLIEIVAIMAFCPGGITTFGLHFEARAESEVLR